MNRYRKMTAKFGLPLVGLLTLSACGGGGDAPGAAVAVTPTTVNGVASKGLVKHARVLVCRVVNGVVQADAACSATTSGTDGSFTLTLPDGFSGPALIKVMAASGSMMLDETTGSDIPYNMTMRAPVPAIGAGTPVYVTPFSDMAASAMGSSGIDADKVRQAMAGVQTLMSGLGVDLTVMPMVDLKNSGADPTLMGKQANMVAQLTKLVMAARTSSLLKDANGVPCNVAGSDTSQQVACAVSAMSGLMTGVSTFDKTKADALLAAMGSQVATAAFMPIIKTDGTLGMQLTDMTSNLSMQNVMQNAGLSSATVAATVTTMMTGMRK